MNYVRTAILLAGLTALFMGVGYLIGGQTGAMIALVIAAGMNLFSYWNSDRMVLSMYGAHEVDARSAPDLYGLVQELAARANLPMPREELAGVIAHELAHIKNRDTLTMTITATIAGAISMLGQFGMFFGGNRDNNSLGFVGTLAMVILAPLAAMLVQMAISRTREYAADRMGAELVGEPRYLASALARMENAAHQIPNEAAEQNPATAHLFIINPLSGQRMDNLFSTHPATENRIAALEQLAAEIGGGYRAAPRQTAPAHGTARGPWGGGARRGPWG